MSFFAIVFSLFVVLNSIGNVPLFVSLLGKFEVKKQKRIILRELLIALFILMLFNFFGDEVLSLLGISQPVIGVGGGILLFIIAIGMIFPRTEKHEISKSEPLIVPLATPIVAGPGSIATVMVYSEHLQNVWLMSLIILVAWIPTLVILFLSSNIKHLLGPKGLLACQKLGGMLISLIAVQMICTGATSLLQDALRTPQKTVSTLIP